MQEVTGGSVELVYADQGYIGDAPFDEAAGRKIILEVVSLPGAKKGLVLLPRRWWRSGRSGGWPAPFGL